MLMGVSVAVVLGAIFNNLSDKRQYPTAWFPLWGSLMDAVASRNESEDEKKRIDDANDAVRTTTVSSSQTLCNLPQKIPATKTEGPRSLLRRISSYAGGDDDAIDAEIPTTSRSAGDLNENHSNEAGEIQLSTVLAHAHSQNRIGGAMASFGSDHTDVTNNSMIRDSRLSTTAMTQSDSPTSYCVADNLSNSTGTGTIELSTVLAIARGHQSVADNHDGSDMTYPSHPDRTSFFVVDDQTNSTFVVVDRHTNTSTGSVVRTTPGKATNATTANCPATPEHGQADSECDGLNDDSSVVQA
jgi:hypothetical protein